MPPRRTSTNRGRRDVRNTVFVPTPGTEIAVSEQPSVVQQAVTQPFSPSSSIGESAFASSIQSVQMPPASPPQAPVPSADEPSDTQSVRSSRSAGAASVMARHPQMPNPGLSSSVIETISVWQENGSVTKSQVIGELALAFVADDPSELPQTTNIRLDNFSALEKVAPNPAFVMQTADPEKLGEYKVDIGSLARTPGIPTVAFKYQGYVSEQSRGNQAPIILTPSWKVEESQTSVILSYAINPAFKLPISLSNVTLSIQLESNADGSGKPTACQSKPAGSFSKERGMIYWRLNELPLTPGTPSQKVLARFATNGPALPGKVEAKWEISGVSSAEVGLGSGLDVSEMDNSGGSSDPFADDSVISTWKSVGSLRKLVSGTYVAT